MVVESLDEFTEADAEEEFEFFEVVVVVPGLASVVDVDALELSSGVTAV